MTDKHTLLKSMAEVFFKANNVIEIESETPALRHYRLYNPEDVCYCNFHHHTLLLIRLDPLKLTAKAWPYYLKYEEDYIELSALSNKLEKAEALLAIDAP